MCVGGGGWGGRVGGGAWFPDLFTDSTALYMSVLVGCEAHTHQYFGIYHLSFYVCMPMILSNPLAKFRLIKYPLLNVGRSGLS